MIAATFWGVGAFRIFKREIRRLGIEPGWYQFREEALEKIARDWLEANHLRYE